MGMGGQREIRTLSKELNVNSLHSHLAVQAVQLLLNITLGEGADLCGFCCCCCYCCCFVMLFG